MTFDTTASDIRHVTCAACVTLQRSISRACIALVYMPSIRCRSYFNTNFNDLTIDATQDTKHYWDHQIQGHLNRICHGMQGRTGPGCRCGITFWLPSWVQGNKFLKGPLVMLCLSPAPRTPKARVHSWSWECDQLRTFLKWFTSFFSDY